MLRGEFDDGQGSYTVVVVAILLIFLIGLSTGVNINKDKIIELKELNENSIINENHWKCVEYKNKTYIGRKPVKLNSTHVVDVATLIVTDELICVKKELLSDREYYDKYGK